MFAISLIDKKSNKHILKWDNRNRWDYVFQLASKVKRCGEETEGGCGCKQPRKIESHK